MRAERTDAAITGRFRVVLIIAVFWIVRVRTELVTMMKFFGVAAVAMFTTLSAAGKF